ncbi:MAG: hypothetical protein R3C10_18095 [Pirellulales bacterium]
MTIHLEKRDTRAGGQCHEFTFQLGQLDRVDRADQFADLSIHLRIDGRRCAGGAAASRPSKPAGTITVAAPSAANGAAGAMRDATRDVSAAVAAATASACEAGVAGASISPKRRHRVVRQRQQARAVWSRTTDDGQQARR